MARPIRVGSAPFADRRPPDKSQTRPSVPKRARCAVRALSGGVEWQFDGQTNTGRVGPVRRSRIARREPDRAPVPKPALAARYGRRVRNSTARPCRTWNARPNPSDATFLAETTARSGTTEPFAQKMKVHVRMFVRIRPRGSVSYEHVFCLTRTSTLAQRARDALALTRAFLLLEDGDPVDWEVGREEPTAMTHEPGWVRAHRATLRKNREPRRGGQPASPPQPCLCPIGCASPRSGGAYGQSASPQRGSRITTGSSRVAIDR
jgi:hypothetical protein